MPQLILDTYPPVATFLTVNGAVQPGQPISVSWGIYGTSIEGNENFIGVVLLNNNPCYTSAAVPSHLDPTNLGVHGAGQDDVILPIPSQQLGLELYAIGEHILTLSVTGNGNNKGPYTATGTLVVMPDGPVNSWWQWTEPPDGAAEKIPWPLPYSPLGNLFNGNKWSAMKVQCELLETDVTDGTPPISRGIQSVTADISPNANPVQFGQITQNWTWVDSPTGRIGAPTSKTFQYVVNLSVQDSYGNNYRPGNTHPPATVIVSVADNKINDAYAALNANLTAAAAAATGGVTGIFTFGIGAAVGGVIAAGLIAIGQEYLASAKDPAQPDSSYLATTEVVPVISLPEPEGYENSKILEFVKIVLRCLAISNALNRTEGKLIGARMEESGPGISLQTSTYSKLADQLVATAKTLPQALAAAIEELADQSIPSNDALRTTINSWQVLGVPAALETELSRGGASSGAFAALERTIASVSPETLPPIPQLLTALSTRTLLHVLYISQGMTAVLAGIS